MQSIIEEPMDDGDIRYYLPNAKIMRYRDLHPYKTLDELLTQPTDYVVLLYESSVNQGHWTCICRDGGKVMYFDSYGGKPDNPLRWSTIQKRRELGEEIPWLTGLLDKTAMPVFFNDVDYQAVKPGVSTCGAHCVFFLQQVLDHGADLHSYWRLMQTLRAKEDLTYDQIVAKYVPHR
jgi:hypothetical protein